MGFYEVECDKEFFCVIVYVCGIGGDCGFISGWKFWYFYDSEGFLVVLGFCFYRIDFGVYFLE